MQVQYRYMYRYSRTAVQPYRYRYKYRYRYRLIISIFSTFWHRNSTVDQWFRSRTSLATDLSLRRYESLAYGERTV